MNADRTVTADAMRARTGDMLPGKASDPGGTAADSCHFMEAVPWRFRTGSPWRDLPERFGNWNSVFRRFRRRAPSGVFERVSDALSEESGLERVSGGGTVVRATRKAAGARGDLRPGDRTFQGRPDEQGRGRRGRARLPGPLQDPSRPGARSQGGAGASRRPPVRGLRRRQGVRRGPAARGPCGARGGGGGPVEAEPDGAAGARPGGVRLAAPGGEPLREDQGVPGGRDALRQDGGELRGGDRLVAGVVAAT